MIHNNYTMSIVSGSKAWQYFCKEKSSETGTCKKFNLKIMCKGFSTSGPLRHLKNAHKEMDLDMKRPHEDTGSEIGNIQRKMNFSNFLKSRLLRKLCQD